MKKLLLTLVLTLAAGAVSAAELSETIDRTFDVRPGSTLKLTNVNGRIAVASWDQPRVRVVAIKRVEGDREDLQAALKDLRVEMQQKDGGLTVTTIQSEQDNALGFMDWLFGDHVSRQIGYTVTVPRSMNVKVSNTNGGIELSEINGMLKLDTTNGKIDLARCAGSVDASTTNGSIRAELLHVAKGQPLFFETTNGRISIALPKDAALDVDAGTTNGSISTDLPVAASDIDRNSLRGSINGGGTRLKARTTNGGIEIRTRS
jgi:hypothetical protein